MIRTLLAALLLTLISAASAAAEDAARLQTLSDELRGVALERAQSLSGTAGAASAPVEAHDPFATGVQDFATRSIALSRHIEAVGGPQDLKCIFRGMSEDALARLGDLSEPARNAERARTYRAFAALFEDAAFMAGDTQTQALAALPCPASSD